MSEMEAAPMKEQGTAEQGFVFSSRIGLLVGGAVPAVLLAAVFAVLCRFRLLAGEAEIVALFVAAAVAAVGLLVYGGWLTGKKREVWDPLWLIISGFYCAWLLVCFWSLTSWLDLDGNNPVLLVYALCMVPILFSMTQVVRWVSPPGKKQSIGLPWLSVLGLPVLFYVTFALSRAFYHMSFSIVIILLFVLGTYGFLFLILRTLYLTAVRRNAAWKVLKVLVLFVFPLLGLLVTQKTSFFQYIFWDFSSPAYYLLVVINGALHMAPPPRGNGARLALLAGRSMGYVFVAYFFVCLSPYYALSLLGLLVFGAGLLVLSPIFLLCYQTKIILNDCRELLRSQGGLRTAGSLVLGAVILPLCLCLSFVGDRINFQSAVSYLETGGPLPGGERVDAASLDRSLRYMQGYDSAAPPLISGLYRRVVTGQGSLSENAYRQMKALFMDERFSITARPEPKSVRKKSQSSRAAAELTGIRTETRLEGEDYRTILHLTMENQSGNSLAEYVAELWLPDGVFISNYYLDVEGERKHGLLSERQAALWIYNRVKSTALDPGILYYDGDAIMLQVFPFSADEVRTTGIELLHKGPATIVLDGREVELDPGPELLSQAEAGGAVYVSAAGKEGLSSVQREPRYSFLLDCSSNTDVETLIARIKAFCAENGISAEHATVTAVNYQRKTWPMNGNWEEEVRQFPVEGGFSLSLAADEIYRAESAARFPVMVVVSDDMNGALYPQDTSYLRAACPELDGFLVLGGDGLVLHPFDLNLPAFPVEALPPVQPVLRLEAKHGPVYVRDNEQAEIVYLFSQADYQLSSLEGTTWQNGLRLAAEYQRTRFLRDKEQEARLALVQNSFRTRIMTPLTSYIVLETAEQEAQLKERQARILQSGLMDTGPEPVAMSEPSLLTGLILLLPALYLLHRRQASRKTGISN